MSENKSRTAFRGAAAKLCSTRNLTFRWIDTGVKASRYRHALTPIDQLVSYDYKHRTPKVHYPSFFPFVLVLFPSVRLPSRRSYTAFFTHIHCGGSSCALNYAKVMS